MILIKDNPSELNRFELIIYPVCSGKNYLCLRLIELIMFYIFVL
jgi:hypothetical protein